MSNFDDFKQKWEAAEAASDNRVLPHGLYVAEVVSGEPYTSYAGTEGYRLTFRVLEGPGSSSDHAGREVTHTLWLTEAALPMTKRDAAKVGITRPEQFRDPLRTHPVCEVKISVRRSDDGYEYNNVVRFTVVDDSSSPAGLSVSSPPQPDAAPSAPTEDSAR